MSFPNLNRESGQVFNNADSFAMSFDNAWKNYVAPEGETTLKDKEKLKVVLKMIKDHPFFQSSPKQAKEVALFRIRLLKLP